MFGSMKSKSAIGVIALLLLTTLTPSAMAGKRGTIQTLSGSVCKTIGGTWVSKSRNCYMTGTSASYIPFIIDSKSQLIIESGDFTNYYDITNNGGIVNYGTFHAGNNIRNYANIINYGNFYSNSFVYNYSYISTQYGSWDGCVYDVGGNFDGSISFCGAVG
jgi:hypothetical protein